MFMQMRSRSRPSSRPRGPSKPMTPEEAERALAEKRKVDRALWTTLSVCALLLAGSCGTMIWDLNTRVCLKTAPGTCYKRHVPLHGGAYPCDVCIEWGRK